jgi:hypothetical protein
LLRKWIAERRARCRWAHLATTSTSPTNRRWLSCPSPTAAASVRPSVSQNQLQAWSSHWFLSFPCSF